MFFINCCLSEKCIIRTPLAPIVSDNQHANVLPIKNYRKILRKKSVGSVFTLLPRIWLMAALSLSVHSATTLALISFMYSMNAFSGFLMWGFFLSASTHQVKIYKQRGRRHQKSIHSAASVPGANINKMQWFYV